MVRLNGKTMGLLAVLPLLGVVASTAAADQPQVRTKQAPMSTTAVLDEEKNKDRPVAAELQPIASGPVKPWHTPLTDEGLLTARLMAIAPGYAGEAPASRALVALSLNGTTIRSVRVGPGGVAQIPAVREGLQTLTATGDEGFAMFGIYASLVRGALPPDSPPVVNARLAPPVDAQAVQEFLSAGAGGSSNVGAIVPEEELQIRLTTDSDVSLDETGALQGRLIIPERDVVRGAVGLDVALIHDGVIVGQAVTDGMGVFTIPPGQLTPGYVTLVARGADSGVVMGLNVVPAFQAVSADTAADGSRFVAYQPGNPKIFFTSVGPGLGQFLQTFVPPRPNFPTGGFGGFGGGGVGGGGGGFGTGLLGGLLGGLVGGLIGSQLDDDDDGGGNNPNTQNAP